MALTSSGVLTQEFVDLLSMELLPTVDDEYPFYTNGPIMRQDDKASAPGKQILFDRPTLPGGTYTETSRRLTETTPIGANSQSISMTQVALVTREYAGPYSNTDAAVVPFGITEFLRKRAKHDLVQLIGGFLRRDRVKFLDQVILDLLLASTNVVVPTATEGTITAGQAMTVAYLRKLGKAMKDGLVPTFGNGKYRLYITTQQESELMADSEYREANRYLALANPAFKGQTGSFGIFDIATSTRIPTKAVGSGGSVTGQQCVAFGPLGIGHGVAMEPVPAAADDTDFGRQERVIWKSHECFGTLMTDMLYRGVTT